MFFQERCSALPPGPPRRPGFCSVSFSAARGCVLALRRCRRAGNERRISDSAALGAGTDRAAGCDGCGDPPDYGALPRFLQDAKCALVEKGDDEEITWLLAYRAPIDHSGDSGVGGGYRPVPGAWRIARDV